MTLFCPSCLAYFPAGVACPSCGAPRPPALTPPAPGQALWRCRAPGDVAGSLAMAELNGRTILLVPWGHVPLRGEPGQADGGVVAVDALTGQEVWPSAPRLGAPVEGGVAVTADGPPAASPGAPASGHRTVIAALGHRGVGTGEGWLAAVDLATGGLVWRQAVGGLTRCIPALDEVRVYVSAGDGALYWLDARNGQPVGRRALAGRATQMPAAPVPFRRRGMPLGVIAATYAVTPWQDDGKLFFLDDNGHDLWPPQDAGGNVRGAPVVVGDRVYVAAFRSGPSTGVLSAFDLRSGSPAWAQPFVVQAGPGEARSQHNFSASPLFHNGMLYQGCLNRCLYAVDAATGAPRWKREVGGAIATTPAWVEGLLIFGANDGNVYALDGQSGEPAWQFPLSQFPVGASSLTSPLVWGDRIVVGALDGSVAVLPWHLGRYAWAAERLERAGRFSEAGDCRALAGHFAQRPEDEEEGRRQAAADWERAGQPEKTATLWAALDRPLEAAASARQAGGHHRKTDPQRAARYFGQAAERYHHLRQAVPLNECTRALASCARLPYVVVEIVSAGFVQFHPTEVTLQLSNEGQVATVGSVGLWLGGALHQSLKAELPAVLEPGNFWRVPVTITPTQRQSTLVVEVDYLPGLTPDKPLRGMLLHPIDAVEPPVKPPEFKLGDVGYLKLEIAGSTMEGVRIISRDVGMVRAGGRVGEVTTGGDVGVVIGRHGWGPGAPESKTE